MSDAATGGTSYTATAIESTPGGSGTPGTPVVPNLFLPTLDNAIKPTFEFVKPEVQRGTRMTQAIAEPSYLKIGGPVQWELNPTLGWEYFLAGLGGKATLTAIAPVQTTAGVTTTNGLSTITAAGTWIAGSWVKINVTSGGAETGNTETRQVVTGGTGSFTVGNLVTNASAATGIYVTQPVQDHYANSLVAAGHSNQLPTLTFESDKTNWAWRFPGCYVDTLDIDFTKEQFKVQAGLAASADPLYEASGVAYAPNASQEAYALRPFTAINGLVVAGGDPDATGTSTLRAAMGTTDIKISFKNAVIYQAAMNLSHTYTVIPGDKATCEVTMNEIATAKRPDVFNDYIQSGTKVAFIAGASKNYGTTAAPDTGAAGFRIPSMQYTEADPVEKIGSVNTFSKKGTALAPAGGQADYLECFVLAPS